MGHVLKQWFSTLLEIFDLTSSITAFIEPFVVGKVKCALFSSNSEHMYTTIFCINAQTFQAQLESYLLLANCHKMTHSHFVIKQLISRLQSTRTVGQ